MQQPSEILDIAFETAMAHISESLVDVMDIAERVEFVCRNTQNRACVRLLMACLLAKVHKPEIDIRKPFTEIGDSDVYSGRTYDESYISTFIVKHDLPCNPTTAFLTPALRNRSIALTPEADLVGRPPKLYETVLILLDHVHSEQVCPDTLLAETVRVLLVVRDEKQHRMGSLLTGLKRTEGNIPLSAEAIVTLIEQHLQCPHPSRLPVLVVAAAYQSAEKYLGERGLPLQSHTAADEQTGALGDLEITLIDDENVVTSYEMKMKRVTRGDIDRALQKVVKHDDRIDSYIFITTDVIEDDVSEYAAEIYKRTGGIEVVILDCIAFLRHFLHLFHRLRIQFLEAYQSILLSEPDSAVRQELKEAFLALRGAFESVEIEV